MKKRIFALMMSILLIVISASGAFASEGSYKVDWKLASVAKDGEFTISGTDTYEFTEVARSKKYALSYENKMNIVCVTDLESGNRWFTSPPVSPKSLPSSIATDAMSPIVVSYSKKGNTAITAANSYTHSLREDGVKVTKLPNGIRFDYNFVKLRFIVPIQFTVDEEGFVAEILFSEIKETGENVVVSVDFLKYFGAAMEGTEGYMIVPDGAGALIKYDNGKDQTELQYSKDFYGLDMSTVTDDTVHSSRSEAVTLPMFGVVQKPIDYQNPQFSESIDYNDVKDTYEKDPTAEIAKPDFSIIEKQDALRTIKENAEKVKKALDAIDTAIASANKKVEDAQAALTAAMEKTADSSLPAEELEKAQKAVEDAKEKLAKAQQDASSVFKSAQSQLDNIDKVLLPLKEGEQAAFDQALNAAIEACGEDAKFADVKSQLANIRNLSNSLVSLRSTVNGALAQMEAADKALEEARTAANAEENKDNQAAKDAVTAAEANILTVKQALYSQVAVLQAQNATVQTAYANDVQAPIDAAWNKLAEMQKAHLDGQKDVEVEEEPKTETDGGEDADEGVNGEGETAADEDKETTEETEPVVENTDWVVNKEYVGFLAEVESGAEIATLKANVSGMKGTNRYSNFNNIYTNATYRITYSIRLKGQISSSTNVIYNAQDAVSIPTYRVRYRFVNQDANYAKIARMYRDVLIKKGWLKENGEVSDRFYVEFYGAVNKKKSLAGFVYNARETLTSFNDAQSILQQLKDAQVSNVHAMYTNYADDYFSRDIQINLEASGSLGGEKDLAALIQAANGMNANISLGANFEALPSGGNGFSTFFDVADVINIAPIKVYPFSLASNTRDTTKKPYYLLKATSYEEAVTKLIDAANAKKYNALYFNAEAIQLYSDLAPGGYQADRVSAAQMEQFKRLKAANIELTMSNPNAYLFAYADYLTDIPVCSSKEILFDKEIPFLQMILRGSKNFGGESMNITDVSDEAFLRHLAYGTDMKYALINASSESLLKTDHTFLYSATFSNFKSQIAARYAAFVELDAAVDNATIVDYVELEDGTVTVTTYENGVKVYVNYGAADYTDGDTVVKAKGYLVDTTAKGGAAA